MFPEQMIEDALDFSRCKGFVKLSYLKNGYLFDLIESLQKRELTNISDYDTDILQAALIIFGQEIMFIELELFDESIKQNLEIIEGWNHGVR